MFTQMGTQPATTHQMVTHAYPVNTIPLSSGTLSHA